jgi:hypothetical protein
MPTPVEQRKRSKRAGGPRPSEPSSVELPFGRKNYIIFAAAAGVIVAGYVALSRGSITLAPILLLLGYLVLLPWGIMARSSGGE